MSGRTVPGALICAACMLAFCGACARKTLEIRLPDEPAWREAGATANAAASILRQLEDDPDDIAVSFGGGSPARKMPEQAF